MNISRQKLYSLGEPFGDSATQAKLGGGYVAGGGGGGKGASPAPAKDPAPIARPQSPEEQAAVDNARNTERQRRAAAAGTASTMLTGGQGATGTAATTSASLQPTSSAASGKTMLGQ